MNWDLLVIFSFITLWIVIRPPKSRKGVAMGLAAADQSALERALEMARRLEQRVETLERLLDEDAPGWRARVRA
jgi:phage shock protein B